MDFLLWRDILKRKCEIDDIKKFRYHEMYVNAREPYYYPEVKRNIVAEMKQEERWKNWKNFWAEIILVIKGKS